jgi:hypothetical protein
MNVLKSHKLCGKEGDLRRHFSLSYSPFIRDLLLFCVPKRGILCLMSEDAFVITCVANLMEVKVLYVQRDLRYEMSSYWRFNVLTISYQP